MSEGQAAQGGDRGYDEDGPLVGAARRVEHAARGAKSRVSDKVEAIKTALNEKSPGEMVENARDIVRERPLRTMLIALGVGVGIGYLIARRSR